MGNRWVINRSMTGPASPGDAEATRFVPPTTPGWIDGADLAADQADAAAVECAAQVDGRLFLAIPRANHDAAGETRQGDGQVQRRRVAADLVDQVGAYSVTVDGSADNISPA